MEKYTLLSFIGEGSFGRVFKVRNLENDGIFALKIIRKKGRSLKDFRDIRQECDIQQHLRHPNIIRMIESFDTDSELVVITEFAEKELHGILGKEGCLQEPRAQNYTWDLVSALYYLHSHRVLHRDLKPQNVLIDSRGTAKLCDFGLARNMTTGTHVLTSIKGTPLYMAPELLDEKPYDHQADLWSLGCIVYEMMAGQPPFLTSSIVQLVMLIRHRAIQWPSFISPDAISFLQGLLHKNPALRMSWSEILVHPFVKDHILILPEQSPIESPFTQPPTQSQLAAKQLQKDRINAGQKYLPHGVKVYPRRDVVMKPQNMPDGLVSDDDSIRAMSAISVRDSLRTDDEEQPIVGNEAKLLANEYKILNEDNLIISNLDSNLAQLVNQPIKMISNPKIKQPDQNKLMSIQEDNKDDISENQNTDVIKRKLSQNLKNFSIKLKRNPDVPSLTSGETSTSTPANLTKENDLSKSVPPSYKQKLIRFSKDKLSFRGSNKITRSLKKSLNLSKNSDKSKTENTRRMSEPVTLNTCTLSETNDDSNVDTEKVEDEPEIHEDLKLVSNEGNQDLIDDDNAPIENEEWLAFMKSNMIEVMEGDVESLTQQNIVSMVVGIARHSGASAEVRGSLAALLSLPLVAPHVSRQTISAILNVYLEVKLVPNLVYAARQLVRHRNSETNSSENSVKNLSNEELQAICRLFELTTHLCLRGATFVQQLCDAVAVLNIAPLMAQFLSLYPKRPRIVLNTIILLITILQDLPENAELVESVLFESKCIDLFSLLAIPNDAVKIRICVLVGLLSKYCCNALNNAFTELWQINNKKMLEELQQHQNHTLGAAAKCAIKNLIKMPFYKNVT